MAQGKRYATLNTLTIGYPLYINRPEKKNANIIFKFTPTPTYRKVLNRARIYKGSFDNS